MRLVKCLLDGVEPIRRSEPFDGRDLGSLDLGSQRQTRPRRLSIEEHGATAADALLAANVRPAQAQVVPEKVREQQPRFNLALM
jgi:hypothetical protein